MQLLDLDFNKKITAYSTNSVGEQPRKIADVVFPDGTIKNPWKLSFECQGYTARTGIYIDPQDRYETNRILYSFEEVTKFDDAQFFLREGFSIAFIQERVQGFYSNSAEIAGRHLDELGLALSLNIEGLKKI